MSDAATAFAVLASAIELGDFATRIESNERPIRDTKVDDGTAFRQNRIMMRHLLPSLLVLVFSSLAPLRAQVLHGLRAAGRL